jgi:superfamily II DNA or RNA helicase
MVNSASNFKGIHLSIGDNGLIHLIKGEGIDDLDWKRIQNIFSTGAQNPIGLHHLEISPVSFEAKAEWLKVWKQEGKTISWDQNVVLALNDIRQGTSDFLKIINFDPNRHKNEDLFVPGISKQLTIEQIENVLCLLDMPNGSNFSVPGAGKTLTTLALWSVLLEKGRVNKLLVVCPRSAFEAWKWEISESLIGHYPFGIYQDGPVDPALDVVVVNYEKLENPTKLNFLIQWCNSHKVHLVIDEAHRIKGGGKSVRWRASRALSINTTRVDLLTGTPMPNGPDDLEALFAVSWPKLSREFLRAEKLSKMKRKTTFVRTTKEELGLPEVSLNTVVGDATPLHQAIIDALRDRYAGIFELSIKESQSYAKRGKAVMTMLAAATNPGLLVAKEFSEIEFGFSWPPLEIQEDSTLSNLIANYLEHEQPWKFRAILEQVQHLSRNGKKVIIWSSFVGNLAALKRLLTKFQPAVVYGGTNLEERDSEIARFRNDPKCHVLLTNPQTLGEGISLHLQCNDAIYLDRSYNAGLYLQSLDRIHRLGLPAGTETNVTFFQTKNSIDERVMRRLEIKISNLSRFLHDASLVTSSIPTADEIPAEELLGVSDDDLKDIYSYLLRK